MDRARRVAALWNWLPAFRTVAEYESIHKAAHVLHVSPSALSRTIKLLEEAVAISLFVRSPSGLALTSAGTELLRGAREAMRRVDDAVALCGVDERRASTLVVGARSAVLSRLVAVAASIWTRTEGPRLRLKTSSDEHFVDDLLRGNVDLVLLEEQLVPDLPDELAKVSVGALVYRLHAPSTAATAQENVVVIADMDPPRGTVVASVESIDDAAILAASGGFRALLPSVLAPTTFTVVDDAAVRVAIAAVRRKPLATGTPDRLDDLIEAVRLLTTAPPT